ncbi:MAG: histidine kinase [Chloroflexota bacterium]|nr:histidine kinase [Chloroflexota bacterium]
MMTSAVGSLWDEPRIPHPPNRVWRDWVLVGALVPMAAFEGIFRDDVVWRPIALMLGVGLTCTLLWRRTQPLAAVAVTFGALFVVDAAALIADAGPVGLNTMAYVLLLPYALFRWGSGREAVAGLVLILVTAVLAIAADATGPGEAVFGAALLLFLAALGASVRYRATSRLQELDRVKLREREQLARDLHDTVAHHVSAIAIRAQAGRVVEASEPGAAVDALTVIEAEASRTLAEMRMIVAALRVGNAVSGERDLGPQRGVADIDRLARTVGDSPRVEVELSGDFSQLQPSIGAAIYRLAQESITNAVRHASSATRISVSVIGEDDCVRLTVADDGDAGQTGRGQPGYGLVGMTERAILLGGTLEAGPTRDSGWIVNAVLPRAGSIS